MRLPKHKTQNTYNMKMTLNTYQIADALKNDTCARWSYNGSLALAEHLEEYEESTGEEIELDTCAIRCDFSEHSGLQAWAVDYFGGLSKAIEEFGEDAAEFADGNCDDDIREYIQDHGTLIEFEGGIIVSSF
jgi:hypothetical protein